jgi:nicotinamide-nucleotide amidase
MIPTDNLLNLANHLGELLKQQQSFLAVAESCTGGWLAEIITSISGSSAWFERGFVTYSNSAKQDMLGVSLVTLMQQGAVSRKAAIEMAEGVLLHSKAQYGVAITGIAGPDGGTAEKPVGTVWIAWSGIGKITQAIHYQFQGDRTAVRMQAVEEALRRLVEGMRNWGITDVFESN